MDTKQGKLPKREDIPQEFRWKREDMYAGVDKWEQDFKAVKARLPELESFRGQLGASSANLLKCLELRDQLSQMVEKLFVYAKMGKDEDTTNGEYQALTDRAMSLSVETDAVLSFVVPEILTISTDKLHSFVEGEKRLEPYKFFLQELLRQKEHILSASEEQLLAQAGEIAQGASNIFGMLNNADIKFPQITDEEGKKVELTKGRYSQFMESQDRKVRKQAFDALYSTYGGLKHTLAASLNANVKTDIFFSRVRKYNSALEGALDGDNIQVEVYDNLIKAVRDNLPSMYDYVKLRRKALQVEQLHMYDLYAHMVPDVKMQVEYKDAKTRVKKALAPLGREYLDKLGEGLESGWIDVWENEGKAGGAYSWGCYGTHPYVLLNYQGTLNDVFTLAHEMGHALHTAYSNENQPYINAQYTIFLAEVASTVNEALVMDYVLKNTSDKREKIYLLNHYLEQFRGTVYRQTMFAEFEKIIHDRVEQGEALTPQQLNEVYHQLNVDYYGPDILVDEAIDLEWSRIPHFYTAFYVYKYATGFSAAIALSRQILREGPPAVERYLQFLKSGGSDHPLNLLKKAGVDMSTPEPVVTALGVFRDLVAQMEKLLD